MGLEVRGLRKSFGGTEVLRGVNLSVGKGECVVILGPSGCGKSTLLRCIAGLEAPDGGSIFVDSKNISRAASRDRNIALVFQHYALYSHKTVIANLEYPLKLRRIPRGERVQQVTDVLRGLGLLQYGTRSPDSLSGGERQRVALGRALVRKPSVFLLDEPLSSVDPGLRESLRVVLESVYRSLHVPSLHVTHDQEEALLVGDRIAVLLNGMIQQCGSPIELLAKPRTYEVAAFVGRPRLNLLEATLRQEVGGTYLVFSDGFRLMVENGRLAHLSSGQSILCGIRPWAVAVHENGLEGVVRSRRLSPPFIRLELSLSATRSDSNFVALVPPQVDATEGKSVRVLPLVSDVLCFDPLSRCNLE